MTSAQRLVFEAAGCPEIEGSKAKELKPEPGTCAVTGEYEEITAPVHKALGKNFVDTSIWRAQSDRVGKPALWCSSGGGRKSPRMWTWICTPGRELPDSVEKAYIHGKKGICQTNRSMTTPVIDTLLDPPDGEWMVCVAVSGQKHVLPYANTNVGREQWEVRMEDTTVTSNPDEFRLVFETCLAMRRLGLSDEAILTRQPLYMKTSDQLEQWKQLAETLEPYRTSPVTTLALWCITKPILENTNDY